MNPTPVGTIFSQNSPDGTVEPVGSEVDLAVSLGQITVPTVVGSNESSATRAITAAGLTVGKISLLKNCIDPGLVQLQDPRADTQDIPGTALSITMATCNSGGGSPTIAPK